MLAAALVYVTIVVLAVTAMLEGSLAFARVSAKHATQRSLESGIVAARSTLLSAIASQVQAHAATIVAPPSFASSSLTATFAITGVLGSPQSANVSATELQSHPAIAEGRVAATISATVRAPSGAALSTRTEYLTLRTFSVPPFVSVDGMTDAAAARDTPYEADAGGCDPATPVTCDNANPSSPASPAPLGVMNAGDTRIRALRRCVDGGSGACAGQPFADGNPASIATQTPWFNANAQGDGWSR